MPKIKIVRQTVKVLELGQLIGPTIGRYQMYYLPAMRPINIKAKGLIIEEFKC